MYVCVINMSYLLIVNYIVSGNKLTSNFHVYTLFIINIQKYTQSIHYFYNQYSRSPKVYIEEL